MKHLLKIALLSLLLTVFLPTLRLAAAEQKIGVFNLETVFKGYYKTKIAEAYITAQGEEFQKELEEGIKALQILEAEYNTLRDAASNIALDAVEREAKRQEAESMARQIGVRRTQLDNESMEKTRQLQEMANTRRREIFSDITAAARERAELEGFTLLLDSSSRTPVSDTVATVVYAAASIDITDAILDELNRGYQPPVPQPANNTGK
jgi:Skp family chaperone for outer membrane proteins